MSAPVIDRRRAWAAVAALAFVVALYGGEAAAQQTHRGPPNALQGFSQNRDQPVKIRAASLEVREKKREATFSGDVHVIQGDTEMRCKSLTVFYDEDAGGQTTKAADSGPGAGKQIRRIEARGGVSVTQKDQKATGDSGIFDMRANTVTLVGNVVVSRGTDVLRGQRLVVDLENGVSKMDQGRVEGLFQAGSRNSEKK
jgi:lipopolysaccharide export system protein LptA